MDDNQLDKDNPEYNKIRHFKATWKDYVDFWEKKGARMTPWKEWDQKYPSKAKMKKSDPVHSYKTFDDESVKESNDGPNLANINVKKLSKNSLKLKSGDQVIDKSREILGVGTLNTLHPDGTATVQFYDTLQGSTVGMKGDEYRLPLDRLFAVDALADSNQVEEPQNLEIYSNNNFKTFESFKSELNEDNPVAISGSQEDKLPTGKPFVIKSKKKRKGSNEDDDDETQEVANMNTSNVGSK